MNSENLLCIGLIIIMFGPAASVACARVLRKRHSKTAIWLTLLWLAYLLLFVIALAARAETISPAVNFVFCLVAFSAFFFVAASSAFASRFASIVVTAVAVSWLALGTIGALGLTFIIEDILAAPFRVTDMGPNVSCEMTVWGGAGGPSGYDMSVYAKPTRLPFIRYRVAKIRVDQTDPGHREADCASVFAARHG